MADAAATALTRIYLHADLALLHADLALKERALARTAPPKTTPGRYRPRDQLLAFLDRCDYAELLTALNPG